jgi:acetoin utilization deacetylase AcuC-like enzyme
VTTAFVSHPAFFLHEMGPYHPECPERLSAISDRLIAAGLDVLLSHYTAPAATHEQIGRIHGAHYMREVEAASPEAGMHFIDPDTALNPHTLDAARHAAGAAVLAVDLVMRDECRTAFCAVRPPGHHAERGRARGFCIFNSVAIGAAHAMAAHGLERVAVVDFDVHHGNGTEEIFSDDPRVLMVSTFQHPLYPYSGLDNPTPNMVNVPLSAGSGGDEFRAAVRERWLPALEAHRPQLILISAGFDAHREDPLAGLKFIEADYAWSRAKWSRCATPCAGRVVSLLEGGYALRRSGAARPSMSASCWQPRV